MNFEELISRMDALVWGPMMLILLIGTSAYLMIRTGFLPWRNLPYALKSTLSREARTKKGEGDVSPFSALTTTLAATIGTGNIVGVATAMVAGGPGALIWMLISACFGLNTMFAECMLAIKYRETNEQGEMAGGPMYTMKKGLPNKKLGSFLGWWFAFFAVAASFGIGNMTQSNSIASALHDTFGISMETVGIVVTIAAILIIVGGIKSISKVSSVVVPVMAIFYMICAIIVILGNVENVPASIVTLWKSAFSKEAVSGGMLGTITASMMEAMRYGIARGVFSNEAGMGSSAITAAAATTDNPVKQGYISMTGVFWDTIVVCSVTGLAIAASGVLGMTEEKVSGTYKMNNNKMIITTNVNEVVQNEEYNVAIAGDTVVMQHKKAKGENAEIVILSPYDGEQRLVSCEVEETAVENGIPYGTWRGDDKNVYHFGRDGSFQMEVLVTGTMLTIKAFETVMGSSGGIFVSIGITLFAFATILGWEYNGEKAFEYIVGTYKFNMVYRIIFSYMAFVGATQSLELVWNLSDIANALMIIPNLICLIMLSGEVVRDAKAFEREKK